MQPKMTISPVSRTPAADTSVASSHDVLRAENSTEREATPRGESKTTLEAQLRPAIESLLVKDVMVGGNHLANRLLALKCTASVTEEYDDVLHDYGHEITDIWCAWKAIMALANWRRMEGIDD